MKDMFDAQFIDEYSKKILAFAYGKTGNIHDAEDLSQEILIALFTSIPKYSKIENMDGFVYTICHYCWSNFLRKNKKHWQNVDISAIIELRGDFDVQEEVENTIFIGKMKTEIAYLSRLHRDIITMTYYDGKSSAQISKELNISDSTVQWHLVEIRKKLKGRIEMNQHNENLVYKPIKLSAQGLGKSHYTLRGIGQYRLVDNICYICYGKPLTVEEISRELSVAAAFIEPHLEELVYMDYMKIVDGNKYQTNIFIRTKAFSEIAIKYNYDNVKNIADKIYDALEKRLDDIKAINFVGSNLDKDFLMWILLFFVTNKLEGKASEIISQKKEYFNVIPKKKDGTEHWVRAHLQEDDYVSSLPKEVQEFDSKLDWRISNAWAPNEISSYQVISHATFKVVNRRIFWGDALKKISRVAAISRNNITPSDYDKTLIAEYVEAGLVKVDDDKIHVLIPYFSKSEYDKLDKIIIKIGEDVGEDFFVDYIEKYIKVAKKQIPDFLPDNEKNYAAKDITCVTAVPYYLESCGKLRYPTDEEAKRLGIIIWELK